MATPPQADSGLVLGRDDDHEDDAGMMKHRESAHYGTFRAADADDLEVVSASGGGEGDARKAGAAAPPCQAPSVSLWALFVLFLGFGARAWGGPMAQIAMLKQELVDDQRWLTHEHFNKVLAVYQVLPGPEATELCCYFGMVARGRLGSVVAGLGFIIPGFLLMLLFSWLYTLYGLSNPHVLASFVAIQPAVTAMVFRATHKIGEQAVIDHSSENKRFDPWLLAMAALAAVETVAGVNFFLVLFHCGSLYALLHWRQRAVAAIYALLSLGLALIFLFNVIPLPWSDDSGSSPIEIGGDGWFSSTSIISLFLLGLFAGMVTFGGAYTAIPLIQEEAVVAGGWMTNAQFLDGIAISAIVPAPLVIFTTFVGFVGGGVFGSLAMTLGMFIPAFSFTLIGHELFERLVENKKLASFLAGVTAGVVGLIAVTGFTLLKSSVQDVLAGMLFIMALGSLYMFNHPLTNAGVVLMAAVAGQVFYV